MSSATSNTAALYAVELVASTARLCAMNLLLHGLRRRRLRHQDKSHV